MDYKEDLTRGISDLVEAIYTTKKVIEAVLSYMEKNILDDMLRPHAKELYDEFEECIWDAQSEIAHSWVIITQLNEMENIAR